MECIYNKDEMCTNDQCPMCADYCPVPDIDGVCVYEERVEMKYQLAPKGCLSVALMNAGVKLDEIAFENVWSIFIELMQSLGYVKEEQL